MPDDTHQRQGGAMAERRRKSGERGGVGLVSDSPQRLTRLSALDRLFSASGVVTLTMTQESRGSHSVEIPIKSVDNEEAEVLCRPYRPKPVLKREMIQGKWTTVIDEVNQEYQDKLNEYNRLFSYVWILLGIDIDVLDSSGEVVWSADNAIKQVQPARDALKQMGLVDAHIMTIMRAIRDLTTDESEIQIED